VNPFRAILRWLTSEPAQPGPDDLVELVSAGRNEPLAEMWKGMLESAGIPCLLRSNLRYQYMQLSPIRLYVRYRDLERARAVIAEIDDDDALEWPRA